MSDSQTHVRLRIDSPSRLKHVMHFLFFDRMKWWDDRDVLRSRSRQFWRAERRWWRRSEEKKGREEERRKARKFTMWKKRQIAGPALIITSKVDGNYRSEKEEGAGCRLMRGCFGRPPIIIERENKRRRSENGCYSKATLYISSGGGHKETIKCFGIEQWPPADSPTHRQDLWNHWICAEKWTTNVECLFLFLTFLSR